MKKVNVITRQNLLKMMWIGWSMALLAFVWLPSCEVVEEDNRSQARKAAVKFCDCMDDHDMDYCIDELEDDYSYVTYTSDAFLDEFNDVNTCDTELSLIRISKSINEDERKVDQPWQIKSVQHNFK
ncbi:MAG: hypothetical protein LBE56_04535 [Tannerella sp.]|jgi:hypothetical protein|nr:hypothetical protein [Tannerella sp.]